MGETKPQFPSSDYFFTDNTYAKPSNNCAQLISTTDISCSAILQELHPLSFAHLKLRNYHKTHHVYQHCKQTHLSDTKNQKRFCQVINWQCFYSRSRILKQSVVRVEHLLGHKEEPFPGNAAIVQSFLSFKLDPESCLQQVCPLHWEDASVGILQHRISPQLHLKTIWDVRLQASIQGYLLLHHLQVK